MLGMSMPGTKDLSNEELRRLVEELIGEVARLRERVAELEAENAALKEEVAQISIACLRDRAEGRLAAGGVLLGDNPDPGTHITT